MPGIQCRSMIRPCNYPQCTRPECSRAHLSASAFQAGMVTDTTSGTNIGGTPPQVDVIKSREDEPTYNLTGLTASDIVLLRDALKSWHGQCGNSEDRARTLIMRERLLDAWMDS